MGLKKSIKNLLFKLLSGKKGYSDMRVLGGPARGARLRLDLRKEGSYWLGNYDKWIFDAVPFNKVLKPGDIVWDCGTYVGYYASVFRRIIGNKGKVILFEASRRNYERVKHLPDLNKWDNISVLNLAVGPEHTELEFVNNLGGANGPYNLTKKYAQQGDQLEIEKVKCCGVDELVYEMGIEAPDFIKFDLETAEEFALHNGDRLFREKRPYMLLELHGQKAKDAAGLFFEKYNYSGVLMENMPAAEKRIRSRDEFNKLGIPHVVFCIPESNGISH